MIPQSTIAQLQSIVDFEDDAHGDGTNGRILLSDEFHPKPWDDDFGSAVQDYLCSAQDWKTKVQNYILSFIIRMILSHINNMETSVIVDTICLY